MANSDAPRGFRPAKHTGGTPHRTTEYPIATAYATSIFSGDLVKLVAGGGIELAAAGDRVLGVFMGVQYAQANGEVIFSKSWTAGGTSATGIKAMVIDDPNTVFAGQADGAVTADDVGQLADMIATHAGSALTGRSGQEVNSTTGTGTAQFRILGKTDAPDNDWGANVELLVQIYEHELTAADQGTPGV